jgi:hypothetical protein
VDTFLTAVYVIVDDIVRELPAPVPPGPAPALSRSEVVTLALFAQGRPCGGERAFSRYAARHLRPLFPRLPHRSRYNRLRRRCPAVLVAVGQQLATRLDAQHCAYEVLDSTGCACHWMASTTPQSDGQDAPVIAGQSAPAE